MKVPLLRIAHARSGDKADQPVVELVARAPRPMAALLREVGTERVRAHFGALVRAPIERFERSEKGTLDFVLHHQTGGGAPAPLRVDAEGKTYGASPLGMLVELKPKEVAVLATLEGQ